MIHLVDKVIPLERSSTLPTEAPTTAPTLPIMQKLGTVSHLALEKENLTKEEEAQIKRDAQEEIQRRQNMGEMDIWSEKQATLPPAISKLKGFMIEMSFEYPGEDGGQCLDWYRGQVVEVLNKEKFRTRIKWDRDTLAEGDAASSVHILLPGHWNPRKIRKGGWKEYQTE